MGWLNFVFRSPTRDRFARLVMDQLAKVGGQGEMKYDAAQFSIERENTGFINLANLYHEYCQAPRNERDRVLARFVRGCVGSSSFELPSDFADVHPDLLPVVRSRFYLESVTLQSRARGGDAIAVPQQPIGEHLSLSLVYDLPQAMRSIVQDDLDKWGVTFYEAVEAARANLEQMGNISFARLQSEAGESVFVSANGDNYDASRLVLLDLVEKMPVRGEAIAMVPNRDTFILTGSEDEAGLAVMGKLAVNSFQKPRPISTMALRLDDGEWVSWLPPADSTNHRAFRELRLRTLGMEYNDQRELLNQIHVQAADESYVANYSAVQHDDTGRVSSYCVWSEGLVTLLPETDDILLLRPNSAADLRLAAAGSFDRVRDVVGDLMQPLGYYPERYRVREFPSDSQLAQIGKRGWPDLI